MIGTPVYEVLKDVSRWITPLNFLDPELPEFSPRNCRTLHDITRFCHEKAVHEMFRFGSEHRFPQKSAKQLMCRVPMQFWIIVTNYFMISKNFCSLQPRFGFHFSTLEALVDERTSQSYESFQFKGGAADRRRRGLRARFVADLLEFFDFRCEVQEDAAFARLEGRPEEVLVDRLRILGYLIIYTRQLDMVMHNAGSVHRYRAKMLQGIETVRQWRGLACLS